MNVNVRFQAIEEAVGHGPVDRGPMALGGAIEGADRQDLSFLTWAPALQSADADILPNKRTADARTNDLVRNDGYVRTGSKLNRDSIVGAAYMLNLKPEMRVIGIDDPAWEEEMQEEIEAKFTLAAESPNCYLDASGKQTLTQQVRMAIACCVLTGESLATSEWLRAKGRPFRTAIQMIDPSRLQQPWNATPLDNVRGGVAMDGYGAPLGYHIVDNNALGYSYFTASGFFNETKYVPIRKPWGRKMVNHIVEMERPHQTRGISAMVTGLMEMKMLKQFRKITLQNAITGAMYAATIESERPPDVVYQALGQGQVDYAAVTTEWSNQYLAAVSSYIKKAKGVQLDGVKIPHLYPGEKLNLRPVGDPGGIGQDFEVSLLRYLAAILDVTYEDLSRDYSKTNYSSQKGGINASMKGMQARKKFVADNHATFSFVNWFEEAVNNGEIEAMKFSKLPNMYEPLMLDAYTSCDWIGAGRGQIDELKETTAALMRLAGNLSTYEEELGKQGKDWRKVFRQIKRERELMKLLDIEPQLNPMTNVNTMVQAQIAADAKAEQDQQNQQDNQNQQKKSKQNA